LESYINSDERNASLQTSCLLIVSALPPSVSERCKADTALLISFLRSTVWDYVSNAAARSGAPFAHERGSSSWVTRLATCPKGLIDMVNSRACRSAIMFNDELRLDECQKLVQRLAGCVFPFVCAHGRPSLVPLADVESLAHGFQTVDIESKAKSGAFVQAWKQWKT
jgi:DNA mismatch repair protein MLH3